MKVSASDLRVVSSDDIAVWLAHMTVTQFRAFRKALATLRRAGVPHDIAMSVLHHAAVNRYNFGAA